jgi:hypothetical protein
VVTHHRSDRQGRRRDRRCGDVDRGLLDVRLSAAVARKLTRFLDLARVPVRGRGDRRRNDVSSERSCLERGSVKLLKAPLVGGPDKCAIGTLTRSTNAVRDVLVVDSTELVEPNRVASTELEDGRVEFSAVAVDDIVGMEHVARL